jgi:acyl dehydratase
LNLRYLEDLLVGTTVALGEVTVDADEMVAFAKRFDPQGFHTDTAAAAASPFGGLVASGWFTGALFMRLYVDEFLADVANLGGLGIDQLQFAYPVRAGDVLSAEILVIEARPSPRKPDRGTLTTTGTMRNQTGDTVLTLSMAARILRRP